MSPATGSGQRCAARRKRAIAWNGQSLCAAMSVVPPPTRVPGASSGASSSRTVSRSSPDARRPARRHRHGLARRKVPPAARATTPSERDRRRSPRTKRPRRERRAPIAQSALRRTRARAPPSRAARCARAATRAEAADWVAAKVARRRRRARRPTRRRTGAPPLRARRESPRKRSPTPAERRDRFGERPSAADRVVRRDARRDPAERRKLSEQLVPGVSRLPFRRRQRPIPGPSHRLDPRTPECGPLTRARAGRPAQLLARLSPALPQALDRRGRARRSRHRVRYRVALPRASRVRAATGAANRRRCRQIRRAQQRGSAPHRQRTLRERDQVESPSPTAAPCSPRHRAKGCTAALPPLVPGHCSAGQSISSASARISSRRDPRSAIAMPIVAPGSASTRSRAHCNARVTSSRGVVAMTRRTEPGTSPTDCAMRDGHPGSRERADEPLLLWRRFDESREGHRGAAPRGDASCVVRKPVGKLPEIDARSRRPSWPRIDRPSERTLAGRRRRRSIRASSRRPRPTHERSTMRRPPAWRARLRRSAASRSAATMRFHRNALCAGVTRCASGAAASDAATSCHSRSSQPLHGTTSAASHTTSPPARCASS